MASIEFGFVLFPQLTQLDLTGPFEVLGRLPGATVHVAAKTVDPVESDCGLNLVPTVCFADCPDLDLIWVPGGSGVTDVITTRNPSNSSAAKVPGHPSCEPDAVIERIGTVFAKRRDTYRAALERAVST